MRRDSALLVGLTAAVAIACATAWDAPPRFDGAGYAVLARSIAEGRGYRAIDHPDEPRYAHFPPGYPLALAAVRAVAGDSVRAIHGLSWICALGATLAANRWFALLFGRRVALPMGLALALNWAWDRAGGGIQSEPLFALLGQLAILSAWKTRRADDPVHAIVLGALLGAAFLTRHVAVALAAAVFLDLALSRRWRNLTLSALTMSAIAVPWLAWGAWISASGEGATQADLLSASGDGIVGRIVGQLVFYVQRIPDQLTGPFVEVATVFRRSTGVLVLANAWAILVTMVTIAGWIGFLKNPRRRLAGLIPLVTLGLLLAWPFTEAGRFLVPLVPCLILGAVEGLSRIARVRVRHSFPLPWVRHSCRTLDLAAIAILAVSLPYGGSDLVRGRARSQDAAHRDFDAACAWIADRNQATHPGPVLTRHPGEVFLQTGRKALDVATSERAGSRDADPAQVADTIDHYQVAYLLIDDRRYANAPTSPLARFVAAYPGRTRQVWSRESGDGAVTIREVVGRPSH